MGTWNAFELLQQARATGLPMPRHAFLSAMAAPDIPVAQRPWRRQRDLSEPEFQVIGGHEKLSPEGDRMQQMAAGLVSNSRQRAFSNATVTARRSAAAGT